MLLNFTVANYRSIRHEQTLSMEATEHLPQTDFVAERAGESILLSAVLYGANSSGKSNLIRAFGTMKRLVLGSVKLNPHESIPEYDPFLLSTHHDRPTHLQVTAVVDGAIYRYGFEYTAERIEAEWLYAVAPSGKESEIFVREGDEAFRYAPRKFPEGKLIRTIGYASNRLILSLSAQLSGAIAGKLLGWFAECQVLSGVEGGALSSASLASVGKDPAVRAEVLRLFDRVSLGFDVLHQVRAEGDEGQSAAVPLAFTRWLLDQSTEDTALTSLHPIYDDEGVEVERRVFSLEQMESEGTKKLIAFSGYIFEALARGQVLWIDELDAKLHPLLTSEIIRLFCQENPNGAQLIFSTHDTSLLNSNHFRDDQIWFTEKTSRAETQLYSLVEFRPEELERIRSSEEVGSSYLRGRFGGIPYIKSDREG